MIMNDNEELYKAQQFPCSPWLKLKRLKLVQHAHSDSHGSHSHTYKVTSTQLQPHGKNLISDSSAITFQCMLGLFMFQTLTMWHRLCRVFIVLTSYMIIFVCAYTRKGWAHWHSRLSTTFLTRIDYKTHTFFLCWWDSNFGPLDIEADALPIEPPCHPNDLLYYNLYNFL